MIKRKRKFLNKKGSLLDIIFFAVIMLFFGMVVLISFKVTSEFNDQIQDMDAIPTEGKTASNQLTNYYPGIVDNMFLVLAVGLAIAAFMLAALVRIHPIFIPFYIIALLMVIFFSGIFSNIYQSAAETTQLITQANQLIFISHILEFLPFIVGILGTILMVVMYKIWQNNQ